MDRAKCVSAGYGTIGEMRESEWGYAVPWAYEEGTINLNYSAQTKMGGTARMEVLCVVPRELYHVWLPGEYRDTAQCIDMSMYPRRRLAVKFEEIADSCFFVWTDLAIETIECISGVSLVRPYVKGKVHVYVDPRYDMQEIKNEIERLARE